VCTVIFCVTYASRTRMRLSLSIIRPWLWWPRQRQRSISRRRCTSVHAILSPLLPSAFDCSSSMLRRFASALCLSLFLSFSFSLSLLSHAHKYENRSAHALYLHIHIYIQTKMEPTYSRYFLHYKRCWHACALWRKWPTSRAGRSVGGTASISMQFGLGNLFGGGNKPTKKVVSLEEAGLIPDVRVCVYIRHRYIYRYRYIYISLPISIHIYIYVHICIHIYITIYVYI